MKPTLVKIYHLMAVIVLLHFFSCTSSYKKENQNLESQLTDSLKGIDTGYVQKAKYIFYNMYSPIEMSQLFTSLGANYKPELLNSINNTDRYNTNSRLAINLGIYGVDLCYLRMFKQNQTSLEYLKGIQFLSEQLGIPRDIVSFTTANIEKNMGDKDSLIAIANDAYAATDMYLKGNERENMAALIMLGGWIESMYITLNMYDKPNKEIIQRVIDQKYSLNSMIAMLNNVKNDYTINEYIEKLKILKRSFFQLQGSGNSNEDIDVDTTSNSMSLSKNRIEVNNEQTKEINSQIKKIRKLMTE